MSERNGLIPGRSEVEKVFAGATSVLLVAGQAAENLGNRVDPRLGRALRTGINVVAMSLLWACGQAPKPELPTVGVTIEAPVPTQIPTGEIAMPTVIKPEATLVVPAATQENTPAPTATPQGTVAGTIIGEVTGAGGEGLGIPVEIGLPTFDWNGLEMTLAIAGGEGGWITGRRVSEFGRENTYLAYFRQPIAGNIDGTTVEFLPWQQRLGVAVYKSGVADEVSPDDRYIAVATVTQTNKDEDVSVFQFLDADGVLKMGRQKTDGTLQISEKVIVSRVLTDAQQALARFDPQLGLVAMGDGGVLGVDEMWRGGAELNLEYWTSGLTLSRDAAGVFHRHVLYGLANGQLEHIYHGDVTALETAFANGTVEGLGEGVILPQGRGSGDLSKVDYKRLPYDPTLPVELRMFTNDNVPDNLQDFFSIQEKRSADMAIWTEEDGHWIVGVYVPNYPGDPEVLAGYVDGLVYALFQRAMIRDGYGAADNAWILAWNSFGAGMWTADRTHSLVEAIK